MSNEYMDLVIMTNGKVCRAPGFSKYGPVTEWPCRAVHTMCWMLCLYL